ncbi:hypothetical protein, partial [Mesomycoplasma ovipneumoniae]|uniref:hypothetical protein n=1 Tax=Mesomycoplasma ovipneumoniae TaxID=29562 RepID=UPI002963F1BA
SLSLSLSTGLVFIWFLVSDWPREISNKFLTWSLIQTVLKFLNLTGVYLAFYSLIDPLDILNYNKKSTFK